MGPCDFVMCPVMTWSGASFGRSIMDIIIRIFPRIHTLLFGHVIHLSKEQRTSLNDASALLVSSPRLLTAPRRCALHGVRYFNSPSVNSKVVCLNRWAPMMGAVSIIDPAGSSWGSAGEDVGPLRPYDPVGHAHGNLVFDCECWCVHVKTSHSSVSQQGLCVCGGGGR